MWGHLHPSNDDENPKGLSTFLVLERVQVSQPAVLLPGLRRAKQCDGDFYGNVFCDNILELPDQHKS